jgi:WD40 repeat protein
VRTRKATDGTLLYSVLQPLHAGTADQTVYSTDGSYIAVHNSGLGLSYRVHRATDGVFLGMLSVTVETNGLVKFAPDAQLTTSVGGDGTLSRWRIADFRVVFTVGSGYQLTNTTFNFSPDATLQSAAKQGTITIRRRSDASTVRVISGGLPKSTTPVAFLDNSRIAAWASSPNRVTLWRISDGAVLMNFPGSTTNEGVGAIRFSPDGTHLITTGYWPYVDAAGLWQQNGMIRFWRVSDGVLRQYYDSHTDLGVTSPIAWSPDGARFSFGTYNGTAVVARTPAAIQTNRTAVAASFSLQRLSNGNSLLRQSGSPGASYHVESSTNFVTWREISVLTVNSNGYCEFLDTNCHGCSLKYYRSWR